MHAVVQSTQSAIPWPIAEYDLSTLPPPSRGCGHQDIDTDYDVVDERN